jgi:hypothetical protein
MNTGDMVNFRLNEWGEAFTSDGRSKNLHGKRQDRAAKAVRRLPGVAWAGPGGAESARRPRFFRSAARLSVLPETGVSRRVYP